MKTPIARLCIALSLLTTAGVAHAAPVTGQGTWETTLKARDIHGNAVALDSASAAFFYDTTLNVTWLADMNANGEMNWSTAVAWADSLSTGGFTDWRLPTIIDSGDAGCQFSYSGGTDCGYNVQTQVGSAYSEWAHLFHVTLGNLGPYDSNGDYRGGAAGVTWGLTSTAYFQNMQSSFYWSGTEFASNPSGAWNFNTNGTQFHAGKSLGMRAVAVRSGDVLRDGGTVPEPQSLALALTALAGLGLAARRRHRAA